MLVALLLDPSMLAVPGAGRTEDEVVSIFSRALHWAKRAGREGPVGLLQLECTATILAEANAFPAGPGIKEMLAICDLQRVLAAEDLRRAINRILANCPSVAQELEAEVLSCESMTAVPDLLGQYCDPILRDAAGILFATVLFNEKMGCNKLKFVSLGVLSDLDTIDVKGSVDALLEGILEQPVIVEGKLHFADSYEGLLSKLSAADVWERAVDGRDLSLAIAVEALGIWRGEHPDGTIEDIPSFSIGSEFFNSLIGVQAGPSGAYANVVRETCARVVLGMPKQEVGYLKTASGKNLKREDGVLARRTHVTSSHEALRLMYWQSDPVEFANVGPKHELYISPGNPAHRIGRVF